MQSCCDQERIFPLLGTKCSAPHCQPFIGPTPAAPRLRCSCSILSSQSSYIQSWDLSCLHPCYITPCYLLCMVLAHDGTLLLHYWEKSQPCNNCHVVPIKILLFCFAKAVKGACSIKPIRLFTTHLTHLVVSSSSMIPSLLLFLHIYLSLSFIFWWINFLSLCFYFFYFFYFFFHLNPTFLFQSNIIWFTEMPFI